ncbi:MAG: hypothetical protein ACYDBO_03580 [Vulcanimicrobiaceae bacterium]
MQRFLSLALAGTFALAAVSFHPAAARAAVVIRTLGHAPLLGGLHSTADLQKAVRTHEALFAEAASQLGLTQEQYARLSYAIQSKHVRWVTIPRRLQMMTWSDGTYVYLIHDVIIPAHSDGWEVDLRSGDERLALYIPMACGNLSINRSKIPPKPEPKPEPIPTPLPTPVPTPKPQPIPTMPPVIPPPPATVVRSFHTVSIIPIILWGLFGRGSTTTNNYYYNTITPPLPPPAFCP